MRSATNIRTSLTADEIKEAFRDNLCCRLGRAEDFATTHDLYVADSRSMKKAHQKAILQTPSAEYGGLIGGIAELLETTRHNAARTVNALMTVTYWEIGRRIVEHEQRGEERAAYGKQLLARLSADLTARFGRGFAVDNLERFRSFFLTYPPDTISATLSAEIARFNDSVRRGIDPDGVWTITVYKIRDSVAEIYASKSSDTVARIGWIGNFQIHCLGNRHRFSQTFVTSRSPFRCRGHITSGFSQ